MPRLRREAEVGLIDAHVGRRLHQRRLESGVSLQELGRTTGVCYQQIQKYENGANRISASMLWLLGEALNVAPAYFFDGLAKRDQGSAAAARMGARRESQRPQKLATPGK